MALLAKPQPQPQPRPTVRAALRVGYQQAWAFAWTVGGRTAKAQALMAQADYPGATQLLLRLFSKQPTNLDLLLSLAFCQKRLGRKDAHLKLLQEAHRLDDRNPSIVYELAQALVDARRSEDALPLMGLIKDEPGFAATVDRVLGSLAMGRGDAARAKDFQLNSWMSEFETPSAGHSYLFPLAYAETDEARLAQEHQFWADTLPATPGLDSAQALPPSAALKALRQLPQPSTKNSTSKIRLAYWGADFREHSVRYFSRPLIENHDKARFEVFIYSQNDAELPYDAQTEAFKAAADYFFDVGLLSDVELEALMLSHQLDVLVELSGHTAGNRLPMLTRRLAPVQLTGLAYPPTTGLRNVDGKFMDPHIHTPQASAYYAETPLVLPSALWCFDPMTGVPDVGPPPLEKTATSPSPAWAIWQKSPRRSRIAGRRSCARCPLPACSSSRPALAMQPLPGRLRRGWTRRRSTARKLRSAPRSPPKTSGRVTRRST